jgi:hypothetical protein
MALIHVAVTSELVVNFASDTAADSIGVPRHVTLQSRPTQIDARLTIQAEIQTVGRGISETRGLLGANSGAVGQAPQLCSYEYGQRHLGKESATAAGMSLEEADVDLDTDESESDVEVCGDEPEVEADEEDEDDDDDDDDDDELTDELTDDIVVDLDQVAQSLDDEFFSSLEEAFPGEVERFALSLNEKLLISVQKALQKQLLLASYGQVGVDE